MACGAPSRSNALSRLLEVAERESLRERIEDGPGDVVARVELDELRAKRSLVVAGRRRAIARDQARARADRRSPSRLRSTMPVRNSMDEMCPSPTARRLMTNLRFARAEAGLIGRGHERRIEEGGPLDGVLVGEVGADEEAPLSRQRARRPRGGRPARNGARAAPRTLRCRPANPATRSLQHARHFVLREREDARHEQAGARAGVGEDLLARQVGFGDDPARIVQQPMRGSLDHR